jgi:hypothetical protein
MDRWTEQRTYVNIEPRSEERGATGSWTIHIRSTGAARGAQLVAVVGSTAERDGSGDIHPKDRAREVMEKLTVVPHSEPLTVTWTSDFLSRDFLSGKEVAGEGREVIGERLRDKTFPWQVQPRLMQTVTNSLPCEAYLHRMGSPWSSSSESSVGGLLQLLSQFLLVDYCPPCSDEE